MALILRQRSVQKLAWLRSSIEQYTCHDLSRTVFSLTGKWPKQIEETTLHDIETHWKPKVPDLVKDAQAQVDSDQKLTYVLSMFPYPSGQLHMGHVRVYAISDAMAHYNRMMKRKVIHPMGWDAFGLPAENAAIERNIKPEVWTRQNIQSMKTQLQELACLFDWDREFATCDPDYYKWTQYLFIQMFKAGLAYQQEAVVNWDPVDQTVLADEQVDQDGRSWRSGAIVEKRPLKQWFLRTTQFSKDLYDGLDDPSLDNWRDIVKIQRNWIGNCNGTNIEFKLESGTQPLSVWTDRPELIHGVSFIGLSPGHLLDRSADILTTFESDFLGANDETSRDTIKVLKICAINPFSGVKVPILIVPRQDQDSFLGIPDICTHHKRWTKEAGILTYKSVLDDNESSGKKLVNSGPELSGLHVDVAREKVMEMAKNIKVGGFWTSSRLKDWLISRQRYWGTPIPIVHCSSCGAVPVPESDLPVVLPVVDSLSVKGRSPLLQAEEWVNTSCPSCGGPGKRETDTLDTFVDSSWYFARYLDPDNKTLPVGKEASKNLPVDLYIGGKEHATLHMYYARFVTHFMHQIGLSPVKEPFQSLLVQGMVKGQSFRVKGSNQYLWPLEVDTTQKPPVEIKTGKPVVAEWEKMSKSKYNGVDPGDILKEYGCDTTRLLILSDVSPQSDRKWNPKDSHVRIQNMQRRIWKLVHHIIDLQQRDDVPELTDDVLAGQVAKIWDARNFYVRGANNAYRLTKNLAMVQARVQGLLGELWTCHGRVKRDSAEFQRCLASCIILLSPMAPHFCSELWQGLSQGVQENHCQDFFWDKSVFHQPWPELDHNYNLKMIVNKNGKPISEIPIALWKFRDLEQEEAFNVACCDENVQELILSHDFEYEFTKVEDYEAVMEFKMEEPQLSAEALKIIKDDEKEAKRLRKIKRQEKKDKIEADVKAKEAAKRTLS